MFSDFYLESALKRSTKRKGARYRLKSLMIARAGAVIRHEVEV